MSARVNTIGFIRSCFKDKFGVPRQPGLINLVNAHLEFAASYDATDIYHTLEGASHIWIVFLFHHCMEQQARLSVRPPRLGGNRKLGVFATRSTHRPNPIGLSVVALAGIEQVGRDISFLLRGADLVDGTPVLDIKPYLPGSEAISEATTGYAAEPPQSRFDVVFSPHAGQQCEQYAAQWPGLKTLIASVLSQDPRPAYLNDMLGDRVFSIRLYDLDVHWSVPHPATIQVHSMVRVSP